MPKAPATFQQAIKSLADQEFLVSPTWLRQKMRANRVGADADIVSFERAFVAECAKYGIPVFTHCVVRDEQEQQRVYDEGHSAAKFGQSPHNHGMAADIIHSKRAWEIEQIEWELLGHIGFEVARRLNIKVEWGGDWKFWDPAHWQLADWRERVWGE